MAIDRERIQEFIERLNQLNNRLSHDVVTQDVSTTFC